MSQQHIQALLLVKSRIARSEYRYICHALPPTYVGDELRRMIVLALGATDPEDGSWSVGGWLHREHGIQLSYEDERLYRLAWIDWMIEGWQTKGNEQ
jgi:hypothetical protein